MSRAWPWNWESGIEQDPEAEEVKMNDLPGSPSDELLDLMSLCEDTANAVRFFFDEAGVILSD